MFCVAIKHQKHRTFLFAFVKYCFCVRSLQVKSQLLQTLNGFASLVNLQDDVDFAEIITPDITVQVNCILNLFLVYFTTYGLYSICAYLQI